MSTEVDESRQSRAAALMRFARLWRDGSRPSTCLPPRRVVEERKVRGLTRLKAKVIFDTEADAKAYADVVERMGGGPSWVYRCQFSRRGHVHLTSHPHHTLPN